MHLYYYYKINYWIVIFCVSVLGSIYIKNAHMKRRHVCLKKRGLELSTTLSKYCVEYKFISNTYLAGHTCRP